MSDPKKIDDKKELGATVSMNEYKGSTGVGDFKATALEMIQLNLSENAKRSLKTHVVVQKLLDVADKNGDLAISAAELTSFAGAVKGKFPELYNHVTKDGDFSLKEALMVAAATYTGEITMNDVKAQPVTNAKAVSHAVDRAR